MSEERKTPSRKYTSRAELFQIYEMLKKVGTSKDGYYYYKEGWSDAEVAKSVSPNITTWPVRDIRQQSFGKIYSTPHEKKNSVSALMKRVEELETLYLKLQERLDAFEPFR